MSTVLFMLGQTLFFALVFFWGFSRLPRENWQILAALPGKRREDGNWAGTNLTYYGVLTANATLVAVVMLFFLLGAVGVSAGGVSALTVLLLALCFPAAKILAYVVEKKAHTLTVGGAVFVGVLAAPWLVWGLNRLPAGVLREPIPMIPAVAAMAIAYAYGEGLGRLACISFGCCYGKPLRQSHPLAQWLFRRRHFIFRGATKKIAYASGLEGEPVIPIQAVTAVLYVLTGMGASLLFLTGHSGIALVLAVSVTQGWRVYSETLRADYRGTGSFSAYQVMGLLAIPYVLGLFCLLGDGSSMTPAEVGRGLHAVWSPLMILSLQGLWLAIFLFTGRSAVTGATLSFHVHHDRI